jgi:uncharacterized protein YjbI with pentapeptide repeats
MGTWLRRLLGSCCLLLAVALAGCGGDRGVRDAETPAAARLDEAARTLTLPRVRSGQHTFLDLRLVLEASGEYRVLAAGGSVEGGEGAPDATLLPALSLQELTDGRGRARLMLRRLHIGNGVFHSAEIELAGGRWHYAAAPQPSRALVAEDFRVNAGLVATHDNLLVLRSAPGEASTGRIRLEGRLYEFCLPAQTEGADEFSLYAPGGERVLQLRAGDPCASVAAAPGVYEWRHAYGGLGSSRTLFLGRSAPPMARPARQASPVQEYWAMYGTWTTAAGAVDRGFLTTVNSGNPPDNCFGSIAGFVQANVVTPLSATGMATQAAPLPDYASVLLDGLNFFQVVYDANGNPSALGAALTCNASSMGYFPDFDAAGVFVLPPGTDTPRALGLVAAPQGAPSFYLTADVSGVSGSLGRPLPYFGFPYGSGVAQDGYGGSLQPVFQMAQAGVFQRLLRYRPQGLGPTEPLPAGWVAMFRANDCSGPALMFEGPGIASAAGPQGLPALLGGGSLGPFDGSLRLGALTTATLFAQAGYGGESHLINQQGCISQAQGWGTSGWKADSFSVQTNPVRLVLQEGSCKGCNLAGVDFTGYAVAGLDLSASDLSATVFTGSDLSNVNLQDTQLHGAQLDRSNLFQANLCRAGLNAVQVSAGGTAVAASLKGANLHNANLNLAHLESASFDNSNFYGDFQGACSTDCSMNGCASAHGAFINDAKFPGAFMSYVDMSGVQGPANFANAVLVGALFAGANLAADSDNSTSFDGAFLMGADFSNAVTTPDMFSGAYYDNSNTSCWSFVLPQVNLRFPSVPTMVTATVSGSTNYKCTTSTAAITSTCVPLTYQPPAGAQPAAIAGGPQLPVPSAVNGNCTAQPPLCGLDVSQPPGTQGYANQCWGPIPPLSAARR